MGFAALVVAICGIGWTVSSHKSQPRNQGKAMSTSAFDAMCAETRGKSAAERRKIIKRYTRKW